MPTPASPGTNQYRCNACGRYFNNEGELKEHQFDCVAAKRSTGSEPKEPVTKRAGGPGRME